MTVKPNKIFGFFGRGEEKMDSPLSLPPVKGIPKLKEVHIPYVVYLKPRVLGRLVALLQFHQHEFGFVLRGKLTCRKFIVTSLYVPPQEVGAAHWEATDYTKVASIPDIVGWGHSHNCFGAFHSDTDIITAWGWAKVRKVPICSLTISSAGEWDTKVFLPDDTYTKAKLVYPGCQIPEEWLQNIKPKKLEIPVTYRWEDWEYG